MKKRSVSFVSVSIGLLLASVVSVSAFAAPYSDSGMTGRHTNSMYRESSNAPRFKMTYSSLHKSSVARRHKAEMAALETRETHRTQNKGADRRSIGEN